MSTGGAFDTWLQKIRDVQDEMVHLRKEKLANAGVPLSVIDSSNDPSKWRRHGQATTATAAKSPDIAPPVTPAPSPGVAPGAKDSPEDVNSSAALPEDPNAQSIDDFQPKTPRRLPGVASLKSIPTPSPAAAPAPAAPAASAPAASSLTGRQLTPLQQMAIQIFKRNPKDATPEALKRVGLTPEDLR
jgi:hypothetical protein